MTKNEMSQVAQLISALTAATGVTVKGKPAKRRSKGKKGRTKLTDAEKAVFMAKNDAACVAAFAEKGLKVTPRVDVLTYDKWTASGRMVRKGEKSTQVGPFRLFHISQTDAIATPQPPVTEQTVTANVVPA